MTRRTLALIGLVVVVLAGVLTWIVISRSDSALTVSVTVRADTEEPVEVYQGRQLFSASSNPRPQLHAEVDLSPWQGQLIRIDVAGEVRPRAAKLPSTGYAACQAEIVGDNITMPLEFVGWENDGAERPHIGILGCPTFSAPGEESGRFAYRPSGPMWYVLRAPQEARLKLTFMPVLEGDVGDSPKPMTPTVQAGRMHRFPEPNNTERRHPDVFIYAIDALRADHVGCYGYDRGTTPAIDEFAGKAVLYEDVHTAVSWTRSSVSTLLSGLYPSVHGVFYRLHDKLPQWPVILPEIFSDGGYATCAITTNTNIAKAWGFDQGYERMFHKTLESPQWVNQKAAEFLAGQDQSKPVFIYIHTMEPHSPYRPGAQSFRLFDRGFQGKCDGSAEALKAAPQIRPRLSSEDLAHLVDLYDAECFDADRGFSEFLDLLRRSGRYDDALVILVADHGEQFAEHGMLEHGRTLNREELFVPLIIRFPGGRLAGKKVSTPVSLIDVFPTVLTVADLSPQLDYLIQGTDLGRVALSPNALPSRHLYAEVSMWLDGRLDLVSVMDKEGYKSVIDMSTVPGKVATEESIGLWDTKQDPGETRDLSESLPVRAAYHEQLISTWLVQQRHWREADFETAPSEALLTEEMRQDLRSLGYLD